MRGLAFLLFLLGLALLSQPWWPAAWGEWLPSVLREQGWRLALFPLLLAAVLLGARLLLRRSRPSVGDDELRRLLAQSGLLLRGGATSWQAAGSLDGVPVLVRRDEGYQAGRFGRTWVLVLEVAGRPRQPWPLLPRDATLLDQQQDDGFSVVLPAAATTAPSTVLTLIKTVLLARSNRR